MDGKAEERIEKRIEAKSGEREEKRIGKREEKEEREGKRRKEGGRIKKGKEKNVMTEEADGTADGVSEGRSRKRRRITAFMAAKTAVFCMLVVFSAAGIAGTLVCAYMGAQGYYTSDLNTILQKELSWEEYQVMYDACQYLKAGDLRTAEGLCKNSNIDLELAVLHGQGSETVLWSTWSGDDKSYVQEIAFYPRSDIDAVSINGEKLTGERDYVLRSYLDLSFPYEDFFQRAGRMVTFGYENRYKLAAASAGCVLLCVCCFVFLMCGAGRRNGKEDIVPGILTVLHLDIMTALFGGAFLFLTAAVLRLCSDNSDVGLMIAVLAAGGTMLVMLATVYCMDVARRVKMGRLWRYSLVYVAAGGVWRAVRFVGRLTGALLKGLPTVFVTMAAFFGICILEFNGMILLSGTAAGIFLWGLEKAALFVLVLYIALTCKSLLKASAALASGQDDYRVETKWMLWDFKEHGENLNSLGQGISKAVADRMKSEHLKTELISNVSHDLKTPLTSIINYADLICEEVLPEREDAAVPGNAGRACAGEESGSACDGVCCAARPGESSGRNARIREYAEVLLRQSRRLKKLLEDLIDAAKATTGNVEVNLESCEAGVLLSQAVGEYQQKMEEKRLELIARQPEQPVMIMADGRHLWRVFDNLLNNICKYAQENSRVYLNLDETDGYVRIIFRNMSKYALDISAKELEERFVRGDRSRHMEGNGLGLSIAKSLVELQNGKMDIVIDGDLFKVTLGFAAHAGGAATQGMSA